MNDTFHDHDHEEKFPFEFFTSSTNGLTSYGSTRETGDFPLTSPQPSSFERPELNWWQNILIVND